MLNEFEGKIIADKYRIDGPLLETDLGTFYRGWHVLMDRSVIVKVLATALAVDRRLVDRFLAETKAESHVSHPNLLSIMDFGTDASHVTYAVYEGFDAGTLRDLLDERDRLTLDMALKVGKTTASALAAAHSGGLIHGALSPQRILVNDAADKHEVKVFGFGSEPVGRHSTADPRYLAPEQLGNAANGNERSDVYSLGAVLYEMLSGSPPYQGTTAVELLEKQANEPPPPLSAFRDDVPGDLEAMMLSAMALDPDRRYQDMSAFGEDLATLSKTMWAETTVIPPAAAARKHNIWQTAFVALAGITVLAAVLIYATSGKKTDPTVELKADAGSFPVQPIGPATGAMEESLANMPPANDAEIMSTANTMLQPPGTLAGGDNYNPWANGVNPPPGAPPAQYVPPGGQYYTIDPNTGSPFMPPDGGVVLVPVPVNNNTVPKTTPTPKGQPADANTKPAASPVNTPKPLATPVDKPAAGQPAKPAASPAKPRSGKRNEP